MANVIRYVNRASTPGGDGTTNATTGPNRAYADTVEWEAAEQTNLVTDGDNHYVYLDGNTPASEQTAALYINGWTTGTNNRLYIMHNADTPRHDGTMGSSTGYKHPYILNYEQFVHFVGLILTGSNCLRNTNGEDIVVEQCISDGYIWQDGVAAVLGDKKITINSSVIDLVSIQADKKQEVYFNNSVALARSVIKSESKFYGKNSIFAGSAAFLAHGTYTNSDVYLEDCHLVLSGGAGITTLTRCTEGITIGDYLQDHTNGDFNIVAGHPGEGDGQDLTGTVDVDMFGDDFGVPYDVGSVSSYSGGGGTTYNESLSFGNTSDLNSINQKLSIAESLSFGAIGGDGLNQTHTLKENITLAANHAMTVAHKITATNSIVMVVNSGMSVVDTYTPPSGQNKAWNRWANIPWNQLDYKWNALFTEDNASFGNQSNVSQDSVHQSYESINFAQTSGFIADGFLSFSESISFSGVQSLGQTGSNAFSYSVAMGTVGGVSAVGGLHYTESVTFAGTIVVSSNAADTIIESMVLNSVSGFTLSEQLSGVETLLFGLTKSIVIGTKVTGAISITFGHIMSITPNVLQTLYNHVGFSATVIFDNNVIGWEVIEQSIAQSWNPETNQESSWNETESGISDNWETTD